MNESVLSKLTKNHKAYILSELIPVIIKAQIDTDESIAITTVIRQGKIIGQKIETNKAIKI